MDPGWRSNSNSNSRAAISSGTATTRRPVI